MSAPLRWPVPPAPAARGTGGLSLVGPPAARPAALEALARRGGVTLQLATIAELGAKIAACRTIEEILRVAVAEARWVLTFAGCTLALLTPDGRHYRPFALDAAKRGRYGPAYPCEEGRVGWTLRHNQALRIDDLDGETALAPAERDLLHAGARSALILPLPAEGMVIGTINFSAARPGAYPPEALGVARLLALQIGGATRNALLLEELDGSENVILSLALAIEAKDPYTRGHCLRLADLAERLGRALDYDAAALRTLRMAATLHDVGKIAVPEAILGKPGRLTDEEYAILQRHPIAGAEICAPLRSARAILPAIRHHHERWDGAGYPDGLAGGAIPRDARIIAIVDAYDAMTSDRPYRRGLPPGRALAILRANAGPQWDPALVALFAAIVEGEGAAQIDNRPPGR
jgi:hypothetical protein